jgi:hypothetical protein
MSQAQVDHHRFSLSTLAFDLIGKGITYRINGETIPTTEFVKSAFRNLEFVERPGEPIGEVDINFDRNLLILTLLGVSIEITMPQRTK